MIKMIYILNRSMTNVFLDQHICRFSYTIYNIFSIFTILSFFRTLVGKCWTSKLVHLSPLSSRHYTSLNIPRMELLGTVGALATGQLKPASKEFPRPGPLCFEDWFKLIFTPTINALCCHIAIYLFLKRLF